MTDGYFYEFAGIAENGRVYSILQLLKNRPDLHGFRNLFPVGQREIVEKILYYSFGVQDRTSNLKHARIWNSCEPSLQIYTNDGRKARFAGEIPTQLKLARTGNGLYKIFIESTNSKEFPDKNGTSERFFWKNPSADRIPIYYDSPNPEQKKLLQRVGTENIQGSQLVKYKKFLKLADIKGLGLIPEVHKAGPGLCLLLEPGYNESQELGMQGRIELVYAKYKRDLSPLPKKGNSENPMPSVSRLYMNSMLPRLGLTQIGKPYMRIIRAEL
ncbi:hypothetical protein [Leptospira ainlahdjerensis]|uniref:hypothetical protein n=1 Tax=Leptospira ainlahdjerensis TaxID=2810033 RepID=UPI001E417447|nr:hypothetical protein [Leptospira ainlahdjerensis]